MVSEGNIRHSHFFWIIHRESIHTLLNKEIIPRTQSYHFQIPMKNIKKLLLQDLYREELSLAVIGFNDKKGFCVHKESSVEILDDRENGNGEHLTVYSYPRKNPHNLYVIAVHPKRLEAILRHKLGLEKTNRKLKDLNKSWSTVLKELDISLTRDDKIFDVEDKHLEDLTLDEQMALLFKSESERLSKISLFNSSSGGFTSTVCGPFHKEALIELKKFGENIRTALTMNVANTYTMYSGYGNETRRAIKKANVDLSPNPKPLMENYETIMQEIIRKEKQSIEKEDHYSPATYYHETFMPEFRRDDCLLDGFFFATYAMVDVDFQFPAMKGYKKERENYFNKRNKWLNLYFIEPTRMGMNKYKTHKHTLELSKNVIRDLKRYILMNYALKRDGEKQFMEDNEFWDCCPYEPPIRLYYLHERYMLTTREFFQFFRIERFYRTPYDNTSRFHKDIKHKETMIDRKLQGIIDKTAKEEGIYPVTTIEDYAPYRKQVESTLKKQLDTKDQELKWKDMVSKEKVFPVPNPSLPLFNFEGQRVVAGKPYYPEVSTTPVVSLFYKRIDEAIEHKKDKESDIGYFVSSSGVKEYNNNYYILMQLCIDWNVSKCYQRSVNNPKNKIKAKNGEEEDPTYGSIYVIIRVPFDSDDTEKAAIHYHHLSYLKWSREKKYYLQRVEDFGFLKHYRSSDIIHNDVLWIFKSHLMAENPSPYIKIQYTKAERIDHGYKSLSIYRNSADMIFEWRQLYDLEGYDMIISETSKNLIVLCHKIPYYYMIYDRYTNNPKDEIIYNDFQGLGDNTCLQLTDDKNILYYDRFVDISWPSYDIRQDKRTINDLKDPCYDKQRIEQYLIRILATAYVDTTTRKWVCNTYLISHAIYGRGSNIHGQLGGVVYTANEKVPPVITIDPPQYNYEEKFATIGARVKYVKEEIKKEQREFARNFFPDWKISDNTLDKIGELLEAYREFAEEYTEARKLTHENIKNYSKKPTKETKQQIIEAIRYNKNYFNLLRGIYARRFTSLVS